MRKLINLNDGWTFSIDGGSEEVSLPHTFNAEEGDGYRRGTAVYSRSIGYHENAYLEILGANSKARVLINGAEVAEHKGGYSAFYVDLTGKLQKGQNEIKIEVDNSPDDTVYPTMADFTFYGGLYRGVNLIVFSTAEHFDVYENGKGLFVTPKKEQDAWSIRITAKAVNASDAEVEYAVSDMDGAVVAKARHAADGREVSISIDAPVLWQGLENPYLYTVSALLMKSAEEVDSVEVETAFREITVDADKGLFLNGKHLKIQGVSRHQDRFGRGNALTFADMEEDIRLILEVGANSVRLAHYQHNQYFYTLCDRAGLLVWAEVPVISRFSKKRQENAKLQLTELITQCRNHPSIFCWSISNEITIAGESKGVQVAMVELNALAKRLDDSRPTVMAAVTMCGVDSPLNSVTDLLGYNHYFGWYMGTFDDLDKWLGKWRTACPDKKLCLSEYGAEGIIRYQGDTPTQGDYSEGYQAVYHENYIKRINECDWLWGSYVWNMFDFGSAARNEGGVKGRNNKGLVTFDRSVKKDAFYLYKAYWSKTPFVYIAGWRYDKRPIGSATVKVYSNLPEVTLSVNGTEYTKSADKVFVFDGLNIVCGENKIVATAKDSSAELVVEGVTTPLEEYKLPDGATSMVRNWFDGGDGGYRADCYSLDDRVGALLKNNEVKELLTKFAGKKAAKLLVLVKPFRIRTLLKLPFLKLGEEMLDTANRYLQTIKK